MSLPDVTVEIAFDSGWSTPEGSRTWTDVTDYVELSESVGIGVGRADEFNIADANTLSLTLDNRDGRFTPGKTSSPYYPDVKIGRPIRVFQASSTSNLITNSTFEVNTTGWVPGGFTFPPTLSTSTAQAWQGSKSMLVEWATGEAVPIVQVTVTGLTAGLTYTVSSYVYVPTGSEPVAWVHGASGTFGFVSTVNDEWTRIRLAFVAEATSVPLQLWPQVPPTVAGQTVYVDGAMVNVGASAVNFNDAATSASTRFLGYVTSWPVAWDGGSESYAKAQITASSRLARLGTDAQLRSVVEEEFLRASPAVLYTLGEPEESNSAADLMGGPRARMVGTGTDVVFGTGVGPGTDGIPAATFAGGKGLRADADLSDAGVDVWMACVFTTVAASDDVMVGAFGAKVAGSYTFAVELSMNAGTVFLTGSSVPTLSSPSTYNDGETHLAVGRLVQNGGNVDGTLWIDGVSVDTGSTAGTLTLDVEEFFVGVTLPSSAGTYVPAWTGVLSYAGLGFTNPTTYVADWWSTISDGNAGEKPGKRLQRYAAYAGVPLPETDIDTGTPAMSHIDTTGVTPLELMRKVERTEGGVLFDAPDGTLTFQHRGRRYVAASQFTIEADLQYLESDYSPQHDDAALINTVTAVSGDGTVTVVATDQASFDNYGPRNTELELFTTDEDEIHGAAWWNVNTYSEPVTRVPTLSVSLLAYGTTDQALILGLGVGSRITVDGLPTQAANAAEDYFVEGYTETITPTSYVLTFNVSPAGPYLSTWVLDSASRSQLDTTTTLAY